MTINPRDIYQGNSNITAMVTEAVGGNADDYDIGAIVIDYTRALTAALPDGIRVHDHGVEVDTPGLWESSSEEIAEALESVDFWAHVEAHDRSAKEDENFIVIMDAVEKIATALDSVGEAQEEADEISSKNDEDDDDDELDSSDDDDDVIEFSCPASPDTTDACPDWREYCLACAQADTGNHAKMWAYQMIVTTILGVVVGVLGTMVGVLIVQALT